MEKCVVNVKSSTAVATETSVHHIPFHTHYENIKKEKKIVCIVHIIHNIVYDRITSRISHGHR